MVSTRRSRKTDQSHDASELPDSASAIAAVDGILAGVGLAHGTRVSRAGAWADGERKPLRTSSQAASEALERKQQPLLLQSSLLKQPGLLHGFSTRLAGFSHVFRPNAPNSGDLNLGFTRHDDPVLVRRNRALFVKTLGQNQLSAYGLLQQRHTTVIRVLDRIEDASTNFLQPATMRGDALMTDLPNLLITVQVADCIPLLLFDPVRRAVAAIHAGWRGTLARIVERTVGSMRLRYGSEPRSLYAVIGPGIGPASYAVTEEIRHAFVSQFRYGEELFREVYDSDPVREKYPLLFLTARAPGHSPIGPQLHLDMWEANRRQLLDAGLTSGHIDLLAMDTAADTTRFFSHRAEQGFTGRMMAAIALH